MDCAWNDDDTHARKATQQLDDSFYFLSIELLALSFAFEKNKCPKRLKWHCHWHSAPFVCVLHCVSAYKWNGICHKCHLQDMKLWYKTHGQTSHKNAIFMSLFSVIVAAATFASEMKWKEMSIASIFDALARTYNNCMFWHIRYNIKTNCECINRLAP